MLNQDVQESESVRGRGRRDRGPPRSRYGAAPAPLLNTKLFDGGPIVNVNREKEILGIIPPDDLDLVEND